MTTPVSNTGVQLLMTNNLLTQQSNLSKLNEQLGSGVLNDNLTDYTPTAAQNLMSFQNTVTQHQAYISAMQNASNRLNMYDRTMTDMENITQQAQDIASSNQTLDPSTVSQLQAQAQSFLQQVTQDLNQQVGGRYVYAGSRYTTQPVVDLSQLAATPTYPFTATTSPTLPTYDTEYVAPGPTTDANAFAQDSVTVNTNQTLTYGVTSNSACFQQLIAGLQFLNNATAPGVDAATYQTNMTQAASTLSSALTALQSTHAVVAGNTNIITQATTQQNTDITNLQNEIGDIQNVDITKVGTQINLLQTQLQASYSATASIIQESILKYL